jgi:hypothetical protein
VRGSEGKLAVWGNLKLNGKCAARYQPAERLFEAMPKMMIRRRQQKSTRARFECRRDTHTTQPSTRARARAMNVAALVSGAPLCHATAGGHDNKRSSNYGCGRHAVIVGSRGPSLAVAPRRRAATAAVVLRPAAAAAAASNGAGGAATSAEAVTPYYLRLESQLSSAKDSQLSAASSRGMLTTNDEEEEEGEADELESAATTLQQQQHSAAFTLSLVSAAAVCCVAGAPPAWAGSSDSGRHSRSKLREKEERYEREQSGGGGSSGKSGGGGGGEEENTQLVKIDDGQLTLNFKGAKQEVEGLGGELYKLNSADPVKMAKDIQTTMHTIQNAQRLKPPRGFNP